MKITFAHANPKFTSVLHYFLGVYSILSVLGLAGAVVNFVSYPCLLNIAVILGVVGQWFLIYLVYIAVGSLYSIAYNLEGEED